MAYSKITDPPRTVKVAIDWLIRIGRKDDNYREDFPLLELFCSSIKSLVGNGANIEKNTLDELCKELGKFIGWEKNGDSNGHINGSSQGIGKDNSSGSGYKSAYKKYTPGDFDTYWVPCLMRKQKQGGNNSCCKPQCNGCNDENTECEPEGCCERCPKRICAKIFIAIIPCLYGVFKFLKEMCNGSGAWKDHKLDGSSQLSKFFTYLGYDVKSQLNESVTGQTIHGLLNGNLEDKLKAVYEAIKEKYKSQNKSSAAPTTIRSMLQWMARMPIPNGIDTLKSTLETKCNSLNNSPQLNKDSVKSTLYATCAMSTFVLMGIERPDNMNKDSYFKELYVSELRSSESHPIPFTGR